MGSCKICKSRDFIQKGLNFMTEFEKVLNKVCCEKDEEICHAITLFASKSGKEDDYKKCADFLLLTLPIGRYEYSPKDNISNDVFFKAFSNITENPFLSENLYYKTVRAFFNNKIELVYSYLEKYFANEKEENKGKIDCDEFITYYLAVFKNAFPGFWEWLEEMIKKYDMDSGGIAEACLALEKFYNSENIDISKFALINLISKHPNIYFVEELLAISYYSEKLWKNAIAYYERLLKRTCPVIMDTLENVNFNLAWAYGKTNNHIKEAERYEETLRLFPEYPNAKNNLGYSCYQQGLFQKALRLFEECIQEERDAPYCYNNKVRVLL